MLSAQKAWPRLTFIINHRRSRSLPASATRLFSKKLEYLKEDGIGRCLSLHYTLNETTMARCTSPIYL